MPIIGDCAPNASNFESLTKYEYYSGILPTKWLQMQVMGTIFANGTDPWAKFPTKEILLSCFYHDDEPPKGFCWDFCQQISWHKSQGISVTYVTITHLNG